MESHRNLWVSTPANWGFWHTRGLAAHVYLPCEKTWANKGTTSVVICKKWSWANKSRWRLIVPFKKERKRVRAFSSSSNHCDKYDCILDKAGYLHEATSFKCFFNRASTIFWSTMRIVCRRFLACSKSRVSCVRTSRAYGKLTCICMYWLLPTCSLGVVHFWTWAFSSDKCPLALSRAKFLRCDDSERRALLAVQICTQGTRTHTAYSWQSVRRAVCSKKTVNGQNVISEYHLQRRRPKLNIFRQCANVTTIWE